MRCRIIAPAGAAFAFAIGASGGVVAQSALAELGLTETGARNFVLQEIKSPASGRRSPIAIAGTRAFLKRPRSARGQAATGLFAWAKAYASSPAFKAAYEGYRKGRVPGMRQYALTVEETVKRDIEQELAGFEQMKQGIGSLPPADQQKILAQVKEAQATLTNPDAIAARRAALEAERAGEAANQASLVQRVEQETPADPRTLFARRLREFLDATSDVNFSARTINLTGGTDGIEFVDKADRARHWMWHEAAIVGREATAAARAAAEAWLKEIER